MVDQFFPIENLPSSIHPQSIIEQSAQIASDVHVGPFSYIGENTKIGTGSVIHPHVCIYSNVSIGEGVEIHSGAIIREGVIIDDRCVIQNSAVIGAEGFGYYQDLDGLKPIPQVGTVHLSQNVDIGANTCVDRATLGLTELGPGVKVDNLVQIGHNVKIGSHSIVCGQSGIAGSSIIGRGVILGGGTGIADHAEIEDGSRFAARSAALTGKFKKGDYAGYPAISVSLWRRMNGLLMKLVKKGSVAE